MGIKQLSFLFGLLFAGAAFAQTVPSGVVSYSGGAGTVPTSVCGDAGHALAWNGSAYTCQAITGGSAGAGGSNTQAQYNQGGALNGITGQTTDGTVTSFAPNDLSLTGSSSGATLLNAPATGGGTLTLPPGADTVAGIAATQTLSNKTLVAPALGTPASGNATNLTNLPAAQLTGTVPAATLPLATTSAFGAIKPDGTTITCSAGVCSSAGGSGTPGGSNTQMQYNNSGAFGGVAGAISNGTTVQFTDGDLLIENAAVTGGSAIHAPTTTGHTDFTLPAATDTLAGLAATQTLTNKTISGASNTLSNVATGSLATVQGNGTKVQLSTGTTTTNDCVKFDANGNTVDNGAACGTSGGITALTGDVTASGTGSVPATLATVNSGPGSVGSSTAIPVLTTNGKGLVTAQTTAAVIAPAGTLTGTALPSAIVSAPGLVNNISITLAPGLTNTLGTCNATPVTSANATIASQNCPVDYSGNHTVVASEVGGILNCTSSGTPCTFTIPALNTTGFQHGEGLGFMSSGSAGFIIASASTFSGGPTTYSQNGWAVVTADVTNSVYKVNGGSGALSAVAAVGSELGGAGASTLGIQATSVTNAMLASGISATKVTTGTLPAAQLPAFTGDATSSAGTSALTLATVNSNVGTFGDATHCASITANAKGQITAASQSTSCPGAGGSVSAATSGYSDNGVTVTAGTYFAPITGGGAPQGTESAVSLPAVSAQTHVNLSVSINATLGAASTGFTVTLRKNGADTALTCTFNPSAATACTDFNAGHSVAVVQTDVLDWKIVTAGTIVGTPTITIADNNGATPGGVTSVVVTVPSRETATGCTITASGTCAITDNTQTKNTVFSGPASGSAAAPTFRTLTPADQPGSFIDYVVNNWYPLTNTASANGGAQTQSVIRWTPFYVDQPITTSNLLIRQGTTAGTSNVEIAVYASNSSARPTGSALCTPAQQANTTINTNLTFACSAALTKGWYWLGLNQNDSTGVYISMSPSLLSNVYGVGATSATDIIPIAAGSPTWATAQTYGTWPSSPTTTETGGSATALAVFGLLQVGSIP